MKNCDVIIPIYNAYDYVKKCIESVIKGTDLKNNQLILINDKSTDQKILPLINEFKEKNKELNIVVISNQENLGFVKTVNIGMKYSQNDVLLLNSDTEVPNNWLEKIKKCAYSRESAATVTPLSNNATLVSIPTKFYNNDIPSNMSIDEYDKIIENCSYCDYPELPTAHGFCMFIKRSVLDKIGYFDEISFGRGYGEENDFSYRCIEYGYQNLLCDNTIVFHKESQSFNGEREKVIEQHTKILADRYPNLVERQNNWCQLFPIQYISDNIVFYMNVNSKKNILILIHDWESQVGGTTHHVMDLINGMKDDYNFHVLAPIENGYKLTSLFNSEKRETYYRNPIIFSNNHFYNSEYKKMLEDIIDNLHIKDIHIHHMLRHFFDIGTIIKEKNLNAILTIHDLYPLCPSITLLDKDKKFCNLDKKINCEECLKIKKIATNNIISSWHETWNKFFECFKMAIVPSEDTKKRINSVYPKTKLTVIEHGIKVFKSNYIPVINQKKHNIALIGVMSSHKGSEQLQKLIKLNSKNYNIHLFGESVDPKIKKSVKNFKYHGKYKREQLLDLLVSEKIELICLFSVVPETYSYTLSEAISVGIPVLTFDLGAGAERIRKFNLGWTIDYRCNEKQLDEKIKSIFDKPEEYYKVLKNIKDYTITSTEKMIEIYRKNYKKIFISNVDKNDILLNKFVYDHQMLNYGGYNFTLDQLLNSRKWKLVSKLDYVVRATKKIKRVVKGEKK